MNLKSVKYMSSTEFKNRQRWLEWVTPGVLQAAEYLKQFATECRAGWFTLFHPSTKSANTTLPLFWEAKYHGRRTLESWNGYRLMSF